MGKPRMTDGEGGEGRPEFWHEDVLKATDPYHMHLIGDPRVALSTRAFVQQIRALQAYILKLERQKDALRKVAEAASSLAEENKRLREALTLAIDKGIHCVCEDEEQCHGCSGYKRRQEVKQALADTVAQAEPIGEREEG